MTETNKPSPKSGAAPSDERKDDRSSLDRLADLTRRIMRVPKSEIDAPNSGHREESSREAQYRDL